ncbi:period circadian protein homolog 3 isoform X5 [Cygnus olor]|uniref:period circadian protein homolog 3 isoform X5 n=1 Tax=Cygnus olor TaxID=8869 RepID=UPI001ADE5B6E|nr:period circadian protein homolog 3 isoform X5 [Cygnus olor]
MDVSESQGSRSERGAGRPSSAAPGAGSGREAAFNAAGVGKQEGEQREDAELRWGTREGASSGRKRCDGPKSSRSDFFSYESNGSSARSFRRQSKVNNSDQLDWSQSHKDLMMMMIQEMKKWLPEDKRSSSKPSTISALNYALQCVQQVQANKEFFQALNDRRVFQTGMMTYSIEELVTVASEHTPKNNDTFVVVFSLLSGRIVHISKQAASILNCKKEVLDSSRFVELLAPQDVSVFYTHTDQSHLPLWNVENQTASLYEYAQVKSFFCRIRGGKDQEQETHCYPFRITPYLVHVCTSVHIDAESCCLALAEKIHSGYEAPRIPMEKRIFTTTHTPGCVFLEIDDRAVPLLGYLPQDLIGTSMLMYLHPEDRKRHSASCFLQTVRSDSTEEPGNVLYDDSKKTPLVPSYQQINCVDSIIRYLESCSIPVLKRKRKSSTNTSSSSSDDDKKAQRSQQEFKALEVSSQTPVSADWEEMLKKQTTAGIVGTPLADLTLSNKSPSVVSATSQCSYSSTIVHVPHPQSEVTTMEDTTVGNERMELLPVNALSLIMVPEELKPVGLTKETLSAHTQKEEQNYVDKFRQRILLSPFRTYLQQGSRSNNGHSCGQGDSPSKERSTASCKKGKHGKFKCQKPQRQSLDSHSCSKNRNSLPREKRTIRKQSFFPPEVSCLRSSSMNVFPPVGFPVYSDSLSNFPASPVGEELALCSLKPEPTSLSQLCCEAPSFPALYPPNLGTSMAVFFHSYPMYAQLPQYAFLPSPQYIYPPSSYPCTTVPLAPPPSAPSPIAPNSANQPFPASSATSTEEQQEGQHDWALQLSSSRGSSPLQLNLLQEELPKPVEPSIITDVRAQAEAKCDNDPEGSGNSASSPCASSEFTDHQLHEDSQSGTGSAASGSGSALFSSLDFHSNETSGYGTAGSGKSSKYFASNDSSETFKEEKNQEAKEKETPHKSKCESAWVMMDHTPEQVLMTYQMPNRIKEEVLKEDLAKLIVMQKQQPWFTDEQKEELAEVHAWIHTQSVPLQINTQVLQRQVWLIVLKEAWRRKAKTAGSASYKTKDLAIY